METIKVWVVTIDTIKNWDECQGSYLPTMNKIFGVYSSENEARHAIWSYFSPLMDKGYEYGFDNEDQESNWLDYEDLYIRTDPNYGGKAYYCVNYHLETLNYKKSEE